MKGLVALKTNPIPKNLGCLHTGEEELRTKATELIVADPRRIDLVRSAHVEAAHHLALLPGTNVALINSIAHVIVTEGLVKEDYVRERCDLDAFESWARFIAQDLNSPEAMEASTGVPAADVRAVR